MMRPEPWKFLRIRCVVWTGQIPSDVPGWTSVEGWAYLRGMRKMKIQANLIQTTTGWRLTGGVG